MAPMKVAFTLLSFFLAFLCSPASAQTDCTNVLIGMSPCLNFITGNSSRPASQCCSQLSSVVRSSPQCLCQVLNGGGPSLGIDVNQTQAMALPRACNVQTPPVSRCKDGAPSNPPSGSTDSPNTVPSGPGSKNVPSTEGSRSSDGNSIRISFSFLAFLLAAISYACISDSH